MLKQKFQTQENNNTQLKEQVEILQEENHNIKNQIENTNVKFEYLEEIIRQLQEKILVLEEEQESSKNCNSEEELIEFESHKCFEIFKQNNLNICFAKTGMQIVLPEELNQCHNENGFISLAPWTIPISNYASEDDYLTICLDAFNEKKATPCHDEQEMSGEIPKEHKMFDV